MASFAVFDQLAVGALLYLAGCSLRSELARRPWAATALMVLGAILLLSVHFSTSIDDGAQRVLALTFLALGCALLILGGLHSPIARSPSFRVLAWPGKLCYGAYLWHPLVLFLSLPVLAWVGGVPALLLSFVLVGCSAYASYRWFELPVNDRIRRAFGMGPSRTL
jgi:peptidoglycan/LPS O-acetylase OafA/YrhL